VKNRLNYWLEAKHPNLQIEGYEVKSLRDKNYNCVAWAAKEDREQWWEPRDEPGCFWPKSLPPLDDSFDRYVQLFELLGYNICADSSLTPGFEKVAIYQHDDGGFTHVARQLHTGAWISKLGPYEDIEHKTPDALNSEDYGVPTVYLQRRLSIWIKLGRLMTFLWFRLKNLRGQFGKFFLVVRENLTNNWRGFKLQT